MVSVCLPSDALLQHLLSYLGFSYLGRGVSLHSCSSKAQLLLLTLDGCHSTLAGLRAPCQWTLAALTGHTTVCVSLDTGWSQGAVSLDTVCTRWSLQAHVAACEPGLTAAPSTENGSHCAPSFQERAKFKVCFVSNVDHLHHHEVKES